MLPMQMNSSQNYHNRSLDVFTEPAKQFLRSYVANMGHSAAELEPIINCAIEEAIMSITGMPETRSDRILRQRIQSKASVYVDAVLNQTKTWQICRERIKAHSSIFLIGAGLSYESDMPLSNILNDLLVFCGVTDWDELRKDSKKLLHFKRQFKIICDRKTPSKSHQLIIKNFPNHILEIICLNWDDLFERAARLVGVSINKQNEDRPTTTVRYLWKFHGDTENIKEDNIKGQGGWVLPDEQGYVFDSFLKYMNLTGLNKQLFTLVIIGYNEKEEVIYHKFISPLQLGQPRPTYRIGLDLKNLHKDNYLIGPADFTINKILPISSRSTS